MRDTISLNKAESFYSKQKFDSAFLFYNKCKTTAEYYKDTDDITYCIVQMARIQQIFGDYFGAESTLIEALPIITKENTYKSAVYNLLGISAKELENFSEAEKNYNEAKKHSEDTLTQLSIYNNIAVVLTKEKKYSLAISILQRILKSDSINKFDYRTRKARILDNLGFAYFKKGEKNKGLLMMNEGLQIRLKEKDSYGSIESYLHLTERYIESNPRLAKDYAKKAYNEATINNSIDERLKALLFLIKIASEKEYALKYAVLNDSITQVRNTAKNQFAKIRYDATVANEENLKLKNENIASDLQLQKNKNEINFWSFSVVVLVIIIIFLFYYFKNKRRQDRLRTSYLTETRIAKKVHDELANDVFHTMSYAESKPLHEPQHKEELINLLDGIYHRSRNISKENDTIHTGEKFETFLIEMLNSYKTNDRQVIIKTNNPINWIKVNNEKKIAVYRVLQELMVNMKKYSQATFVVVGFDINTDVIIIEYIDNGIGIATNQIKKSGLQNVENRIDAIDGTFTFETINKGCKIKITFPK